MTQDADDQPLSDADALANAELARGELRAQIEQQLKTADSIDTKTTALLSVGGVILALVGGRIQVGTDPVRIAAALLTFAIGLAFLACALATIGSRRNFAYGAQGEELVESLEQYPPASIALALAEALRLARNKNDEAVGKKHVWYQRTVGLTFAVAVTVLVLFAVGAIR